MAENGARDRSKWTKVDVKKETRAKLQAYKYSKGHSNVDDAIIELLEIAEKTRVNKNLKGKKRQ